MNSHIHEMNNQADAEKTSRKILDLDHIGYICFG